ncbi:hypothetical protein ACFSTC_14295 [Nonomuraea ferruginea]
MNGVALGGAVALASGCGSLLAGPYPLLVLAGALLAGAGLGALATGALTTGTAAAGRGNLSAGVGAVETARVVGASAGLAGAAVLTTSGVPGITGAGPDAVLLACVAVAVLTAAAASWRMVTARRHRAVQASLRAARQGGRVTARAPAGAPRHLHGSTWPGRSRAGPPRPPGRSSPLGQPPHGQE